MMNANLYARVIIQISIISQNSLRDLHLFILISIAQYKHLMSDYSSFCIQYALHPQFGMLIPPNHSVSFDFSLLEACLQKMQKAQELSEAEELMAAFPPFQISIFKHDDMVILHDVLVVFLNKYLNLSRNNGKKDSEIVLSHNFAQPLFRASAFLGYKLGMTVNAAFNWRVGEGVDLATLSELCFEDFELKWYLTENREQEKLFFGASIVGAFYQAKTIKRCFEMKEAIKKGNYLEEEILAGMAECTRNFKTITAEVLKMFKGLDPKYFFLQLRPLVKGFEELVFTGVFEDTLEVRGTSSGGTGGYDPSFQFFQRVFGIEFTGKLKETQDELMKGMTRWHRKLIEDWGGITVKSLIRNSCASKESLKKAYNEVLQAYADFLSLHSSLIHKFIVKNVPEGFRHNLEGTGGTLISEIQGRNAKVLLQRLI